MKTIRAITTDYRVLADDEILACIAASNIHITLPPAVGLQRELIIKTLGAGLVYVSSPDTIDNVSVKTLKFGDLLHIADVSPNLWVAIQEQKSVYASAAANGLTFSANYTSEAIKIGGVTNVGIYINKTANTGGTLKIHCHQMAALTDDSPTQYANEFKGEFLATSGTMDGIASHFQMAESGTGVMRAVIGVAYLNAAKTLSGTLATGSWISGGLFACSLAGTSVLNGTAVIATGLWSEISNAINTTMTEVKHTAGLSASSKLLIKPTTGECSILYLSQAAGATTVNQAIYIEGGATIDAFTAIDVAATGKAIETATTNLVTSNHSTTHALHIKIGAADGYIPVYAAKTW